MKRTCWMWIIIMLGIFACTPRARNGHPGETTGTITYLGIEGGFYGIVTDDGQHYDPIDLPDEFKQDGLRIRFTAQERRDQASFHMWGVIVEIKYIEKLEDRVP